MPRWKKALGPQRTRLHMNRLRWKKPYTESLLSALGPIPKDSGLYSVAGGVKYSDYHDLVRGTIVEKESRGYLYCLIPLVRNILMWLPPNERVELFFGKNVFMDQAMELLSGIEQTTAYDPGFEQCRVAIGRSKLAKWGFISSSNMLLDPPDYLSYALAQYYKDRLSKRAKWCASILDLEEEVPSYIGKILYRDEVRGQVKNAEKRLLRHGISIQRL